MDSKQLEHLLEKYWNCETSLEEEKALRNYFNQPNVPDRFKESASLFQYFEHQRQQSISDGSFDASVKQKLQPAQGKMRSLVVNSLRIAAGISVVVASVWFVRTEIRDSSPQELVDTYDDPKQAFEETKKALQMISKNFGKAGKATSNINLINEAKEKVNGKLVEKKIDS
jgi:hypothetical protein